MQVTIGLDIGGSTTKVVGFRGQELLGKAMVKASDPITSTYGGIGRFLSLYDLKLQDVKQVFMTGVGSSYIEKGVLGLPTQTVEEFNSVGLGGLYLSGLESAIVVSMGTGTSLVAASRQGGRHIIGTGVGGGTLLGLAKAILAISDFDLISELATEGSLENIDLNIADLSTREIPGLTAEITASNFGKMNEQAGREDLARGIVNLVFQSIGTAAILASRLEEQDNIVFVGSLLRVAAGRNTLAAFADLYQKKILIPEDAEYATAMGAALSGLTDANHRWKK
ncbi:MAG: pantothenate kinase [Eubacteriales bacterium]|nr:pantothenate kinase [Eubacteriales bacterium]